MKKKNKNLRLSDIVLMSVCVVLVLDTVAPSASIGVSSVFWWIFLLIAFSYPYGLVTAELGTTYPYEGGIYDWVKKAFGKSWGARTAWYYWINYAFWTGSIGILFTIVLGQILGIKFNIFFTGIISLTAIWVSVYLSLLKHVDNRWILNLGAIFKALVLLSLGTIGIYIAYTKGLANKFTISNMTPTLNEGLRFLPMVIFNFHGFEIITSVSGDMKNPQKEIPKALILGGSLIAFFYLFSTFGILVAIPVDNLSTATGLMRSFYTLLKPGMITEIFITLMGIFFLLTLISNLVAWATGVNYVAYYASKNNDLPKSFGTIYKKTGMPFGVAIWNGTVASGVVLLYLILDYFGTNGDLFWNLFSINAILLIMSYILMFPAFLRLRKINPEKNRPFRVHGGKIKIFAISYIPMVILIISLVLFFYIPGIPFDFEYFWQVGVPLLAVVLLNEIIIKKIHNSKRKNI
ncbi:MAG: APC family permease [bacterium]|nr:APC family permease [bacterium]